MPKRAEVSGTAAVTAGTAVTEDSPATTTLVGVGVGIDTTTDSTGVETAALLGLGSFFICLDATSSETVAAAVTAGTAGVVVSAEVAEEDVFDVLTILSDYTHISSVFLSSF